MQRKYGTLIGFGLMVVITFMAGFHLGQKKEALEVYTKAHRGPRVDQKTVPKQEKSERVAAILLMPKSYLPLLETFKQRKIARPITILAADISWADGKMSVRPKTPIGVENGNAVHQKGETGGAVQGIEPKMAAQEKPKIRTAMALFFLRSIAAGNPSTLSLQGSVSQGAL